VQYVCFCLELWVLTVSSYYICIASLILCIILCLYCVCTADYGLGRASLLHGRTCLVLQRAQETSYYNSTSLHICSSGSNMHYAPERTHVCIHVLLLTLSLLDNARRTLSTLLTLIDLPCPINTLRVTRQKMPSISYVRFITSNIVQPFMIITYQLHSTHKSARNAKNIRVKASTEFLICDFTTTSTSTQVTMCEYASTSISTTFFKSEYNYKSTTTQMRDCNLQVPVVKY